MLPFLVGIGVLMILAGAWNLSKIPEKSDLLQFSLAWDLFVLGTGLLWLVVAILVWRSPEIFEGQGGGWA